MIKFFSSLFDLFFSLFSRNWLTLIGALLSTFCAFAIIFFVIVGLLVNEITPYIGIMGFLILPILFISGAIIVVIGIYIDYRKRKQTGEKGRVYPSIDLNESHSRHKFFLSIVILFATFFVLAIAIYHSIHFMDTVTFCGRVCHTVMEPEYKSYVRSPHARVKCVECHIGPGADWFVKSKISGTRQVFNTIFHSYDRPVPSPVENLRPSRGTCEQCHWPEHFTGSRLKVLHKYAMDKENTPRKTVLYMHIGGGILEEGIHSWHIDKSKKTTYIPLDEKRQEIDWVKVEEDGKTTIYKTKEFDEKNIDIEKAEKRVMDCIDCHNRPTHIFYFPDEAMDRALQFEKIDRSIPYIKKVGTNTLLSVDEDTKNARNIIRDKINATYKEKYPSIYKNKKEAIEEAINEIINIYENNVFPEMNVGWGTYPNNIGHTRFPGCYRCHDNRHVSENGKVISSNCDTCHNILALEEEKPEILQTLNK
ncbi:MAG: NapC/NirT family cytochrome c [Deferribacterota bacterium]|nr:NapC/NirT family cytochrome c [Deferribacterota bacterium]